MSSFLSINLFCLAVFVLDVTLRTSSLDQCNTVGDIVGFLRANYVDSKLSLYDFPMHHNESSCRLPNGNELSYQLQKLNSLEYLLKKCAY